MRVLWLSPWMRTLARVHAEALARRSHDVLLVTSDQHPESDAPRPYELVLNPRLKDLDSWPGAVRGRAAVRRFAPDVVVAELVRDPRWIALAPPVPRVTVVHDDRPHDAGEGRRGWEKAIFDRWALRSAATAVFSEYVADRVPGTGRAARPVVVPLTSDLEQHLVPAFVEADGRRDFVALGRLRPYKNLAATLAAWEAHARGSGWRGDELVLLGDGDVPALPPHVRREAGAFRYRDVLPLISRAKGSLVNYRQASQSGVQVLSMQLGVTPVASDQGALPEYQPPGEDVLPVDDVAGLAVAFDRLARPSVAAFRGARARARYDTALHADVVAARWEEVLGAAVRGEVVP